MFGRRITHLVLLSVAALPVIATATPADAASANAGRASVGRAAASLPLLAATVTPGTVYPSAKPCTTGTGDHHFTVSGTGFAPDEAFTVTVGGVAYEKAAADGTGAYAVGYDLKSIPGGRAAVIVTGDRGGRAVATLDVGWSGCRSWKNGRIRLTGAGFMSQDTVSAYLDGDAVAAASVSSGTGGEFDVRIVCDPTTSHTVTVSDTHDHALTFGEFSCL